MNEAAALAVVVARYPDLMAGCLLFVFAVREGKAIIVVPTVRFCSIEAAERLQFGWNGSRAGGCAVDGI